MANMLDRLSFSRAGARGHVPVPLEESAVVVTLDEGPGHPAHRLPGPIRFGR